MELFIYNGLIINNEQTLRGSIFINNGKIKQIIYDNHRLPKVSNIIDATNKYILPGGIDTHVHFREPGLTYKATIYSESRSALAGGVTSFFDMPNTIPPTTNAKLLAEKLQIASKTSAINYGFYIAATKNNYTDILSLEKNQYAGIKIFYAASTGNLLCNDHSILEKLFKKIDKPFVIHSEKQEIINQAQQSCKQLSHLPADIHMLCRPAEACIKATEELVKIINNTNCKAHFLHITTKKEISLLTKNNNPLISIEVCPHYLWFDSNDYKRKGNFIKVNPSIKTPNDRMALIKAIQEKKVNTIATDHAPHLKQEKIKPYFKAPSGVPSIQHFYPAIFQIFRNNKIDFNLIPLLTAHNPARIFNIKNRGFLSPGYWADIAIIEPTFEKKTKILHKSRWSIFEDQDINYRVFATIINGQVAWLNSKIYETKSQKIEFNN